MAVSPLKEVPASAAAREPIREPEVKARAAEGPKPGSWWHRRYVRASGVVAVSILGVAVITSRAGGLKRAITNRIAESAVTKLLRNEVINKREPFLQTAAPPALYLATDYAPTREQASTMDLPLGAMFASFPDRAVSIERFHIEGSGRASVTVSCAYGGPKDYREIRRDDLSAESKSFVAPAPRAEMSSMHEIDFEYAGRWRVRGIRVRGREDSQAVQTGSEFLDEVYRTFRPRSSAEIDVNATTVRRHEDFFAARILVGAPAGASKYRSIDDLVGLLRALARWRQEGRPVNIWGARAFAHDVILILVPTFAMDDPGFLWLYLLQQGSEWHIGLVWQVTARNMR